jgi:hypothetical protein
MVTEENVVLHMSDNPTNQELAVISVREQIGLVA